MKINILLVLLCSLFNPQAIHIHRKTVQPCDTLQTTPNTQSPQEYAIKATFLFNFTKFITWPEGSLEEGAPFVIGIVGTDPFGSSLTAMVEGEKMQDHPIVIRTYTSVDEVEECHILFITLTDKEVLGKLVEKVKPWNVLTVGEHVNVEKQGGMIRFITDQNKTKLRINLTATKDAKLAISSKLLGLAEIVSN